MLVKFIEKTFYNFLIKERLWMIKLCEKKIVKYRNKQNLYINKENVYIKCLEEIRRDTKELLDRGTYL